MVFRRLKKYFSVLSVFIFTVWTISMLFEAVKDGEFQDSPEMSATFKEPSDPLPDFKDQYDPKMIEYIRYNHLIPPSRKPYKVFLTRKDFVPDSFSSLIMDLAATRRRPGIFVEAGAYNGIDSSNTFNLECLGWTGLLVECNPQVIPDIVEKNRKSWVSNVCLSATNTSSMVKFFSAPEWPASGQMDRQLNMEEMKVHGIDWIKNKTWVEYERPSFPLYSIIAAAGFSYIDFLSLDVQGAEIKVLKNYPFEKIPIKVILAEIHTFPEPDRVDLIAYLSSKGYRFVGDWGNDYVFVYNM